MIFLLLYLVLLIKFVGKFRFNFTLSGKPFTITITDNVNPSFNVIVDKWK